jgi:GDSL/SGNH-like Acyl-Esterase family found in Pmr5 and Cas1p
MDFPGRARTYDHPILMTTPLQQFIGGACDADEEEFVAEEDEDAVALLPSVSRSHDAEGLDVSVDDDAPPRREGRPAFGWWVGVAVPAVALLGLLVMSSHRKVLREGPLPHSEAPNPKTKHKFASSSSSSSGRQANRTTPQPQSAAPQSPSPLPPSPVVGNGSDPAQDDDDDNVAAAPWQKDVPNGRLCQRHQIIEGRWDPVRLKEPPYRPPSNDTRCRKLHDPSYYASKRKGGGMWDTYQWIPNDSDISTTSSSPCHYTAWNRTMFCAMAKYATVLIVGDSLSWENYASLALLSGAHPVHHGYQRMSWHTQRNIGHAVCDGRTRLVYRRDDYLDNLRDALLVDPGSNLPQVLVLNRGAHYVNDTELLTGIRATLDVVEEWLGRCDQLKIKCHFFWRTTVPGHHHCRTFRAPVNDKATMERHVADLSQYTPKEIPYHWYDFQHQNGLVEAELVHRRVRHRILDGYHINLLRPDGHNDCLHSCYPGKMDVYSQLLLHYLRADRTWNDVQTLKSVHDDLGWNLNVTSEYDGIS